MEKRGINYYIGLCFRSLLQGLVILGPIGATIGLIWYLVSSIDNIIPSISRDSRTCIYFCHHYHRTCWFYRHQVLLGRILVDAMDNLLEHTPGIKYIYSSLKDVMSSFVGDKKKFSNPVWVKTNNNPEVWRIGFLTQHDLSPVGLNEKIAVYLPHSYAISGWVILTEPDNVREVEGIIL
jgi:uncharacterized membrane protein